MAHTLMKLTAAARFATARLTGTRSPLAVYWKITWRCNLRCAYCGVSARRGAELATEPLVKMLRDAADIGMVRVNLSGGEPLLRRDLGVLIRALSDWGVSVGLDTNGALVPDRLGDLKGIASATISLDGDAEIHDRQRGAGAHAAALAGAEALARIGVPIILAGVITIPNHERISAILDAAADLNAQALVQPATPWLHDTTTPNPISPDRAQVLDAISRLRGHPHAGRLANTRTYLDSLAGWPRMPRLPCPGGRVAAVVNPDGQVGCCDFGVPPDPWRDGAEMGFAAAFRALPAPPPCDRCYCATTASVQRALRFEPQALLDLLRRT